MTRQPNASAMPLAAIDAVVLGLQASDQDCREAEIIDLGLIPVSSDGLDEAEAFALSAAMEGVGSRPSFAEICDDILNRMDDKIWIGHRIGFDLAVLKRDMREKARQPWIQPRSLDVQLLAQAVDPECAGLSLTDLLSWLELEPVDEDALTALERARCIGRIFIALQPHLRRVDIRTLAEAEMACLQFDDILDDQKEEGWEEAVMAPPPLPEFSGGGDHLEPYAYSHRTTDVMSSPPLGIDGNRTLSDSMAVMVEEGVSSLFVRMHNEADTGDDEMGLDAHGIITERDVLRHVSDRQAAALAEPVKNLATYPLISIPQDAFVYRAVGRMTRHRLRHLAVVDERLNVVGALSARDLLRLRADGAAELGDEIDAADNESSLLKAWAKLPMVVESLLNVDIDPLHITNVISRELGALTRRAALLAERQIRDEGEGDPPCSYAIAVLGDAARGEMTLQVEQSHVIVYDNAASDEGADRYFAHLGDRLVRILDLVGVPRTASDLISSNKAGRGSVSDWRALVAAWLQASDDTSNLDLSVLLDMRPVHGASDLVTALLEQIRDEVSEGSGRIPVAIETADTVPGYSGRLKARDGRIELGRDGLDIISSTARILAFRHQVDSRSSVDRLQGLLDDNKGAEFGLYRLQSALGILSDVILRQQIRDVYAGIRPTRAARLKDLRRARQDRLLDVLKELASVRDLTETG
ncbi:DUF294 nucleotidyltransferase-like domain-containing protein [Coralliovum pocilloporae]|uniref:DUF294 nucleotidyltransferase-like domain-containing protein n=1 Tax=Coralliovum pocilloporae TaxID=3066369 RepID=UPI003306B2F2